MSEIPELRSSNPAVVKITRVRGYAFIKIFCGYLTWTFSVCFWSLRKWERINVWNIFARCGAVVRCDHRCFRLSFKDSTFHIPSSPGLCIFLDFSSKRHNLLVSMCKCFLDVDSRAGMFSKLLTSYLWCRAGCPAGVKRSAASRGRGALDSPPES